MEIKVTMDETGKVSITTSDDMPLLVALGILDLAKNTLMMVDKNPTPEVIVEKE